ncbi:MAG: hypothetical protein KDB61_00875 [Planctomycetes bacterium]|nr:hypothetical protein [Planctomycetota bacterium]
MTQTQDDTKGKPRKSGPFMTGPRYQLSKLDVPLDMAQGLEALAEAKGVTLTVIRKEAYQMILDVEALEAKGEAQ